MPLISDIKLNETTPEMGYSFLKRSKMSKFSEKVRNQLLSSPFVEKVSESSVSFTADFKIEAVKMNLEGRNPQEIFFELGIDPAMFLDDYPKKSISRWRKIYKEHGFDGLKEERRGKGSTGRPKRTYDPSDPESMRERIAYLEAENYILKKIRALATEHAKKKGSK